MVSEAQDLARRINEAKNYTDIFPNEASIKSIYRELVRLYHPDRQGVDMVFATETFSKLTSLKEEAEKMAAEGRFGEPRFLAIIRTKRAVHRVKAKAHHLGDITTLYRTATTLEGSAGVEGLLKVASRAKDNDLMAAEARALKRLNGGDSVWQRHIPELLDTFLYHDGRRRSNVVKWWENSLNLEELRILFPDGLDPRHVVWVWRRLLMALGYAHDKGIIHGAVLPANIVIDPPQHGVLLVDWCYSVEMRDTDSQSKTYIKAIIPRYKKGYPEEVLTKGKASPATDLYLAARSMVDLLGGAPAMEQQGIAESFPNQVPRQMRAFFKGCLPTKQSMRPHNAWELLREFDDLLKRMGEPYHPRRFIELAVPSGVA